MNPEMISADALNQLIVPDIPIIPFIEGDGIGREIWRGARMVLDAAVKTAFYSKKKIKWLEVPAGKKSHEKTGQWLSDQALSIIKDHRVAIKGPLDSRGGRGIGNLNARIRQALDLFVCIRPLKYYPQASASVQHTEKLDMVVFRENIGEFYCPIEREFLPDKATKLIDLLKCKLSHDLLVSPSIGRKPVSPIKTRRLVIKAFEYAFANSRKSVTLIYPGNAVRQGGFKRSGFEAAFERFGNCVITEEDVFEKYEGLVPDGKVVIKERMTDMVQAEILLRPENFDIIVCLDFNGKAFSNALAAEVDSLGIAYGANIGEDCAVFEAFHGTAPDIAGKDVANPCALILSGAMMLDHMGWKAAGDLVRNGVAACLAAGRVTADIVPLISRGEKVTCSRFSRIVAEHILYQH